jgi:hypothetical protein
LAAIAMAGMYKPPSASIAQCTGYRLSREPEQISLTNEQARIAQVIDSEFHRQSKPDFELENAFSSLGSSHRSCPG